MEGHWRQHELWDGTYDFEDLLDYYDALFVYKGNNALVEKFHYEKTKQERELERMMSRMR